MLMACTVGTSKRKICTMGNPNLQLQKQKTLCIVSEEFKHII